MKRNLTIDYGLRYSLFLAPTYGNGQLSTFDPQLYDPSAAPEINSSGLFATPSATAYANGMIIGGKNSRFGQAVQRTPHLNFAPRLGFAWDPFGNGKNSVRGGYGIFFDSPAVNSVEQFQSTNPPLVTSTTIFNTNFTNPGAAAPAPNVVPQSVGIISVGPGATQMAFPMLARSFIIAHVFSTASLKEILRKDSGALDDIASTPSS